MFDFFYMFLWIFFCFIFFSELQNKTLTSGLFAIFHKRLFNVFFFFFKTSFASAAQCLTIETGKSKVLFVCVFFDSLVWFELQDCIFGFKHLSLLGNSCATQHSCQSTRLSRARVCLNIFMLICVFSDYRSFLSCSMNSFLCIHWCNCLPSALEKPANQQQGSFSCPTGRTEEAKAERGGTFMAIGFCLQVKNSISIYSIFTIFFCWNNLTQQDFHFYRMITPDLWPFPEFSCFYYFE